MRLIVPVLCVVAAAWVLCNGELVAQSTTASLAVTASISKNCVITTTPVTFGAYDPVVAHSTAPLDGTGTVTVTCTKGALAKIGLNDGSNAQGSVRRMRLSAAAYLEYQIYKDASRTSVWGDGIFDSMWVLPAPNRNPRTYPVYGRVPANQDATVGSYSDTVVATVDF